MTEPDRRDAGRKPRAPDPSVTDIVVDPPRSIASARLRRAGLPDIARIVEIERDSFSDPWSAAAFRAALAEERMLFLVAEDEAGTLVGYVVAWSTIDEAELANLAVARSARGEGIGKALVDAALRFGEERGCACMYLEVRESNQAARAVYAARGFEQVGRRKRYYRDPVEDALVLRATLPNAMPE